MLTWPSSILLRLVEINDGGTYERAAVTPKRTNTGGPTTAQMVSSPLHVHPAPPAHSRREDRKARQRHLQPCSPHQLCLFDEHHPWRLLGLDLGDVQGHEQLVLNPLDGSVTKVNRAEGNSVSVEFSQFYCVSAPFF
jgi:hypothetical protein